MEVILKNVGKIGISNSVKWITKVLSFLDILMGKLHIVLFNAFRMNKDLGIKRHNRLRFIFTMSLILDFDLITALPLSL